METSTKNRIYKILSMMLVVILFTLLIFGVTGIINNTPTQTEKQGLYNSITVDSVITEFQLAKLSQYAHFVGQTRIDMRRLYLIELDTVPYNLLIDTNNVCVYKGKGSL